MCRTDESVTRTVVDGRGGAAGVGGGTVAKMSISNQNLARHGAGPRRKEKVEPK